jgi:hypothetical protein
MRRDLGDVLVAEEQLPGRIVIRLMRLKMVVFPAPLGPMMVKISPGPPRLTPSSA